jgi:hypothetical protein
MEETLLSKLIKYLDYVKGFTRTALIFSTHASTQFIASQGGQTTNIGFPRSWICNSDVSPTLDEVRFFLSEETINALNKYMKNFKIQDLPEINITNFTCVDYDVNSAIFSGNNDEEFYVGAYGSKINITFENNSVFSDNDAYEKIAQDRFWYMYRKFKEWAPQAASILASGTCSCLSEICACGNAQGYFGGCKLCVDSCPGFQFCLQSVVENAKEALVDTFNDDYVSCSASLIGCYHELEPCSGEFACVDWEDAPACNGCFIENAGELCGKSIISEKKQLQTIGFVSLDSNQFFSKNKIYFSDSCSTKKCKYWAETKGSMEVVFSCTDKKYLLSVTGDRHLIFSVHAMVKLRSINCYKERNCVESNGNCVCPPGSWCTGCQ